MAALGGETGDLETLGELCCALIAACDQAVAIKRLRQWNRLMGQATDERRELPVMSFCCCCSAEALIAGGRLDDAERELARTLQIVEETGTRGRCGPSRQAGGPARTPGPTRGSRADTAWRRRRRLDCPGGRRAPPRTWRAGRRGSCTRAPATPDRDAEPSCCDSSGPARSGAPG
jgi:hypothetical protein